MEMDARNVSMSFSKWLEQQLEKHLRRAGWSWSQVSSTPMSVFHCNF